MMTAMEKYFFPGRSLRTISQAIREPSRMLNTETSEAIKRECPSGLYSMFWETVLLKSRCQ